MAFGEDKKRDRLPGPGNWAQSCIGRLRDPARWPEPASTAAVEAISHEILNAAMSRASQIVVARSLHRNGTQLTVREARKLTA